MTNRYALIGRFERDLTFLHCLLDVPVFRVQNVLLDELKRAWSEQQLIAQAISELGSFQLTLLVAQRRVNSRSHVFENVPMDKLLSVRSSRDFRPEYIVRFGPLQPLLLFVQSRTGLWRRHDSLLDQRRHRPPHHQLHFQS